MNSNDQLIDAVENNNSDLIQVLILSGANINHQNAQGLTSLKAAVHNGHLPIVKYLVQKGAFIDAISNCYCHDNVNGDVNKCPLCLESKYDYKPTALMIGAEKNKMEIAKYLIDKGANINSLNRHRDTILLWFVAHNNLEMVKYLINRKMDINWRGSHGYSSLIISSKYNYIPMTEYLIKEGAHLNLRTNEGNTALIEAVSKNNMEVIQLLVENKSDLDIKDNNGNTALMTAITNNNLNIIKCLIDNGANVNCQNNNKDTALIIATQNGSIEIIKLLIARNTVNNGCGLWKTIFKHFLSSQNMKCEIDLPANEGLTALNIAASKGDIEIVKYLVSHGSNIDHQTVYGWSSLMMAAKYDYRVIIKYLVERGAKLNIINKEGKIAFDYITDKTWFIRVIKLKMLKSFRNYFSLLPKDLTNYIDEYVCSA